MWDYDHNTIPNSLCSLFIKTNSRHTYGTRFANADKLIVDTGNSYKYGDMSFKAIGASRLNEMKDCDLYRNAHTKQVFMNSLKNSILDTY